MSVLVVDTSVAVKRFIEEEHAEAALSVLDEGNELHAPDFLLLETDNVFLKWVRCGSITLAEASKLRAALRRYPIRMHALGVLIGPAFEIAGQTGRTVYDALYVALAALVDAQVVTADRRLHDGLATGPLAEYVVWVENV